MKRFLILTTSISIVLNTTTAQAPTEKALLWKLTKRGTSKPSYLFGTIHLICASDLKISNEVKNAFNNIQQVYLELDMDDPALAAQMMKGITMKNNESLSNFLDSTTYDSVAQQFKKIAGFPLSLMNKAKPILAMAAIYPALLNCTLESWEKTFVKMAQEQKIEVKGLEKVEEQLAVLDSIPYTIQAKMFASTLLNVDSTRTAFQQLLKLYLQKDIANMLPLVNKDKGFEAYEATMLTNRNRKWLSIMVEQAKRTSTFFAVGAAHLGGAEGVIALLRKNGFTIEPIFD